MFDNLAHYPLPNEPLTLIYRVAQAFLEAIYGQDVISAVAF